MKEYRKKKIVPSSSSRALVSLSTYLRISSLRIHLQMEEMRILSFGQEDPLEREWQPIPVFVPRKPHDQRSLVGYIVHGVLKELYTT